MYLNQFLLKVLSQAKPRKAESTRDQPEKEKEHLKEDDSHVPHDASMSHLCHWVEAREERERNPVTRISW